MTKDRQEATWSFWNAIRSMVTSSEFLTASLLTMEVRKHMGDEADNAEADLVYAELLRTADSLGISNPFKDQEQFYLAYRAGLRVEEMDWEYAIAYAARETRLPIIPTPLFNLYTERFDNNPCSVLVTEAEKFVPNLQKMVDQYPADRFVFTTQNVQYETALRSIFDRYSNVEILLTDIYRYEFDTRRYDLIFASPIFGSRSLVDNQNFMCRETDLVALENLALHLNDGGRLVITLPARVTFASGKVDDLRRFIQLTYSIKEISELPVGTFEGTAIKVYLLDIENTRPDEDDDIIVRRFSGIREKKGPVKTLNVTDDTFVMLSELEEQGDWSLDRIFAQQDEEYQAFQNSKIRKEKIENVAQVFRGKSVNKKDPSGSIGVVNISNLGTYEIDYEGLDHLQEEERKVSNYLLQEGDVILPARGTAIRTAVFHAQTYPCIASSNLIVIRPDPKLLDSTYLKVFLDSPIGNKIISGAQQGMSVMNISYKDLNALEIPLPPLEKQQEVSGEYLKELKIYQDAIAAAEERWSSALSRLQKF